jgi:hypothetical protein
MAKVLSNFLSDLKYDLGSTTEWSDDELIRCLERAVDDVGRFYPQELYYEYLVDQTVEDEDITTASAHGTYINLANKPIDMESEVVENVAGTVTYARGTDYLIDYINGKLTTISTGSMAVSTAYHISYSKHDVAVDLSSIDGLIRITEIELEGEVPQKKLSYHIYGNYLYIGNRGKRESQSELSDDDRIIIYYEAEHTMPSVSVGSIPGFLDQVLEIGASGYALMLKAVKHRTQAATDLTTSRTILATISNADANTALDSVATQLATLTETNISGIETQISGVETKIDTAIALMATYAGYAHGYDGDAKTAVDLAAIDTFLTGTGAGSVTFSQYLGDGDAFINKSNDGQDVAENYGRYADYCVNAALALIRNAEAMSEVGKSAAQTLSAISYEVTGLANLAGNYASVASAYADYQRIIGATADSFVAEANQRNNMNSILISQADRYVTESQQLMVLADTLQKEAESRKSEFWSILKDKSEWRKRLSVSSNKQ